MKRIGIMIGFLLAIGACKEGRKEEEGRKNEVPPYKGFSDEGVAAQQRIGAYLQEAVVTPKLRTCWAQLKTAGAVGLDLTYRKSGDNWALENVKVTKSSLPEDQNAIAQKCITESAGGTTFPVNAKQELEQAAEQFVVRLGWPVPLPPEGGELSNDEIARMIGTGGGAGVITVPGCSDCVSRTEYPYGLKCEAKSSGSNVDCEEINSNTCATTPKACLSGAFGGKRGIVMF